MAARRTHFRLQRLGNERQGDQLGVRMKEGGAGGPAVILECDQRLEANVPGEIDHSLLPRPQHALDLLDRLVGQRGAVVAGLDHHLVRAHSGHAVEHPGPFADHLDLGAQGRVAVGDHAQCPAVLVAPAKHFRRRHRLIAGTKGTDAPIALGRRAQKSARALGTLRRDDHPSAHDRISAKFGHPRAI